MTSATRRPTAATPAPRPRPPRRELLIPMLEGTKRSFVPLRKRFLQKPFGTKGPRAARLADLARDTSALDAYLLIHALASSSAPYQAGYPAATWVQAARLDEAASFGSAKSRWSKVTSRLVELQLIERDRSGSGNEMQYRLLDEAGDGEPYTRPTRTAEGHWFKLPYAYWLDEFDHELTHPEKLMLLIALDQQDGFSMPAPHVPQWYGLSESTVGRGLRGLEKRGLLSHTSSARVAPRSPTGWIEEFHYTLEGPFSRSTITAATSRSRSAVSFSEAVTS